MFACHPTRLAESIFISQCTLIEKDILVYYITCTCAVMLLQTLAQHTLL
jgi:hypothetical protein